MPYQLPKDGKIRTLEDNKISGKSQNCTELQLSAESLSKNESFVSTSEKLLKTEF